MELLSSLLLILCAGFFEGSETAVYRANWIRLTNWLNHRVAGARDALRCLDHRDATIVATMVGTNLCSVFATGIASRFFAETFGPAWTGIAVVLVVILSLILGQYLPKAVAQAVPDRWLRSTGLFLNASRIAFAPAVFGLSAFGRLFIAPLAGQGRRFSLTRQDFVAALGRRHGAAGPVESKTAGPPAARRIASLVTRLFRFSGTKVSELAIPIGRVRSVAHDAGLSAILAVVREHGYSRIPVHEDTPANVIGVVLAKDMLAAPAFRVRRVRRVPETARAMEVLRELQHHGEHLTLLVDAAGAVTGLVTLEDLLEELVGEIRSEA